MEQQGVQYVVDLVMCIDGTQSMHGMIDKVKETAVTFYERFIEKMEAQSKHIRDDMFRIKVIVFRDYKCDGSLAMEESRYFHISEPTEHREFEEFVRGITVTGGGDIPENSLEALFKAIKSDWTTAGGRTRRQAILLFTDAEALPPWDSERTSHPDYPLDMPKTTAELKQLWTKGDQNYLYIPKFGRLIVYAPEGTQWQNMRDWPRFWFIPTQPDGGCSEVDMEDALAVLVGSF